MKWKMIKLILPLFMLVFVMPMIMPGPNGKPVMSIHDWLPKPTSIERVRANLLSWWRRATNSVEQTTGLDIAPEPEQLFKWKDANGTWHFTNRAGMASKDAQKQALPTATNTMAPPPVVVREHDNDHETSASPSPSIPLPLPTTIPVDKIPQLIDDAKKLQKLPQDRAGQLDNL
jgi:hypothetical protein